MKPFVVTLIPSPAAGAHVYGADTLEEAVKVSRHEAAALFASDAARESIRVEIDHLCSTCGGTGYRPTKARRSLRTSCDTKGCTVGFLPTVSEAVLLRPTTEQT